MKHPQYLPQVLRVEWIDVSLGYPNIHDYLINPLNHTRYYIYSIEGIAKLHGQDSEHFNIKECIEAFKQQRFFHFLIGFNKE